MKLHLRWRVVLGTASLVWATLLIVIQLAGFRYSYVLPKSEIRHQSDCAYVLVFQRHPLGWPITKFFADTPSSPSASKLILLEDGKSIGHPHTVHDDIRKHGMGDYSHWGSDLYFSASDCSDPGVNAKAYAVTMPVRLSTFGYITGFLALIVFVSIIRRNDAARRSPFQLFDWFRAWINTSLLPWDMSRSPLVGMAVLASLLLYVSISLIHLLHAGTSISFAAAGFFQVSDAASYLYCSDSLLHTEILSRFANDWCERRPLYPDFLAGTVLLARGNIFAILFLQALFVCGAVYVFLRRSALHVGFIGAAICGVLQLTYAENSAFLMTVTENSGLMFGCVGFAMLLKASENRSLAWVAGGIATVSIALNARAGAFFVLPCLVLWAVATAWLSHKPVWRWLAAAVAAMLAGFVLQALMVIATGGDPWGSFGNFSYTLYGLAVGGKSWSQVLTDHPELSGLPDTVVSKEIYILAWKAFLAQPHLFFEALATNTSRFLTFGTYAYDTLGSWAIYVNALWWLAWVPLLRKYRNPTYLLVALSSLGVAVSAPLLLGDAGPRVFAATIEIDVLQIGIGLHFAIKLGMRAIDGMSGPLAVKAPLPSSQQGWIRNYLEPLTGILFLAVLLIPFTPLRRLGTEQPVPPAGCSTDENEAVLRIGRGGTLLLDILPDDQPADFLLGQVNRKNLGDGISQYSWWRNDLLTFGEGSLLWGYQLTGSGLLPSSPVSIFSTTHLSQYDGRLVQLCVNKTESKQLFGYPYLKLDSVKVLK